MKELRQEHQRKTKGKGNPSALTGSQENAGNGRRKECAQEQMCAVSAAMRTNMEVRRACPLLLKNCRRKAMGNIFERKVSQRPESVWEERSKTLQTVHHWEMHETIVILGTPPCVCVRITKTRIELQITRSAVQMLLLCSYHFARSYYVAVNVWKHIPMFRDA